MGESSLALVALSDGVASLAIGRGLVPGCALFPGCPLPLASVSSVAGLDPIGLLFLLGGVDEFGAAK